MSWIKTHLELNALFRYTGAGNLIKGIARSSSFLYSLAEILSVAVCSDLKDENRWIPETGLACPYFLIFLIFRTVVRKRKSYNEHFVIHYIHVPSQI